MHAHISRNWTPGSYSNSVVKLQTCFEETPRVLLFFQQHRYIIHIISILNISLSSRLHLQIQLAFFISTLSALVFAKFSYFNRLQTLSGCLRIQLWYLWKMIVFWCLYSMSTSFISFVTLWKLQGTSVRLNRRAMPPLFILFQFWKAFYPLGPARRVYGLQLEAEIPDAYFLSFLCRRGIDFNQTPHGRQKTCPDRIWRDLMKGLLYNDVGGATETNKQCRSSQRLSICFPCLDLGRVREGTLPWWTQIQGRGPPTGRWCPGEMELLCSSCTQVRRKEVEVKQPGFFLSSLSPVRTLHCSNQWKPEGKRAWGSGHWGGGRPSCTKTNKPGKDGAMSEGELDENNWRREVHVT